MSLTAFNRKRRELAKAGASSGAPAPLDLSLLTKAQLIEYAAELGIDVSGAKTKNDILLALVPSQNEGGQSAKDEQHGDEATDAVG